MMLSLFKILILTHHYIKKPRSYYFYFEVKRYSYVFFYRGQHIDCIHLVSDLIVVIYLKHGCLRIRTFQPIGAFLDVVVQFSVGIGVSSICYSTPLSYFRCLYYPYYPMLFVCYFLILTYH